MTFDLVYCGHGFSGLPKHPYHQRLCRIIAAGRGPGPHNVMLEFEDGHRLVTRRAFKKNGKSHSCRRVKVKDLQLELL